jgi:hypothetical protein
MKQETRRALGLALAALPAPDLQLMHSLIRRVPAYLVSEREAQAAFSVYGGSYCTKAEDPPLHYLVDCLPWVPLGALTAEDTKVFAPLIRAGVAGGLHAAQEDDG